MHHEIRNNVLAHPYVIKEIGVEEGGAVGRERPVVLPLRLRSAEGSGCVRRHVQHGLVHPDFHRSCFGHRLTDRYLAVGWLILAVVFVAALIASAPVNGWVMRTRPAETS